MKTFKKYIALSLFFLIHSAISYSQDEDSVRVVKKEVRIYKEHQFNNGDTTFSVIDTLLNKYQVYTNRNNLGNNGLASVKQTMELLPEIGFNYLIGNFNLYKYNNDDVNYYNTRTPYTEFFYLIGAKKEQEFRLIHTQNVNKNLNFAANFKRVRSEGLYQRQNTNHNCVNISSNYKSPDGRYSLLSDVIYNNLKNSENGGIATDSSFEESSKLDKKLIPVNLLTAQRRERERSFYLKQFINLGYKKTEQINDSVSIHKLIPTSNFSHSFFIQDNARVYFDNQSKSSGFYSDFFNDSTKTLDSSYFWKIENKISWQTTQAKADDKSRRVGAELAFKHQYVELRQYVYSNTEKQSKYDSSFRNIIAQGRLFNYDNGQKFFYDINAKYVAGGFNKGNYDFGILLKQLFKSDRNYLQFKGIVKYQAPEFFYQQYASNHFNWSNHFNNTTMQWLDIRFISKQLFFEAGCSAVQYRSFVYFDNTANPKQLGSDLKIVSAFLKKDIHIKKFTLSNNIIYQKSADSTVVKIPEFVSYESFFFSLDLFKKALQTQIGFDLFYNTSYFANAYMPATGMFYLQNKKQIGGYPYLDFFLSMKIKTARIFLKYEHINSGLIGNTYYSSFHYPMPDRLFKFGISWKFFD